MHDRRPALLPDHGRREAGLLDARRRCAGRAGHGSMPVRGGADGQARAAARPARPPAPARARDAGRRARWSRRSPPSCRAPLALPLRGLLRPRAHRPAARRARRARAHVRPAAAQHRQRRRSSRGGEKINVIPDEVSVEIDCRLLPGFVPGGGVRRAARARGRRDGARGDPLRPGRRRARHGAVRHARRGAARARPDGQADAAAAARRHRRALLLAPRHPDLRLPADAAARGAAPSCS